MTKMYMLCMLHKEIDEHKKLLHRIDELRKDCKYEEALEIINQANIVLARIFVIYYKLEGVKKAAERLHAFHEGLQT